MLPLVMWLVNVSYADSRVVRPPGSSPKVANVSS